MPIPQPILDDRSYQQLRDGLVRRIPVYAPEWTDHNASDPGVTLIELFAFLGENLLYRFNQIPESARLEFLRLLQIPLRPAAAARALVTLSANKLVRDAAGQWTAPLVPVGSTLQAGDLPFETETEVSVWPLSALAVARVRSAEPDAQKEPEVHEFAVRALDALNPLPAGCTPVFYENKIVDLNGPPVDFGTTVDNKLWIAVLLKEPPKDITAEKKNVAGALLNLGIVLAPVFDDLGKVPPCPGAGSTPKTRAVEWRISKGGPLNANAPAYNALTPEGDTTAGLGQDGVIRLRLPKNPDDFGTFEVDDTDKLGTGDLPPALDEETDKKVLCWLCAFRSDESSFGKLIFVGANAAEVLQAKKARAEFLGTGDAQPDQLFQLGHKPVLSGTVLLDVEEDGRWVRWQETDSFVASKPDDRQFVMDLEAGQVRFGNGLQGLPPQIGQRIRVREYRHGGGAAGNVATKAINRLAAVPDGAPPDVKVENPLRARGGADTESIKAALDRIPGELRRRERTVTAGDFQEIALATPGAEVGRAECLPRFHPPTRQPEAAGIVSVVIWPREDPARPNAPVPDRNLLRTVCAWLDQHRLVTTELYVIPPTYRKVAIAVGLEVKPGYGIAGVRRWVELVLRQYLAPLPPFGPEGQGWPLGRPVIGAELEAAALQVEGVQFLTGLKLLARARDSESWQADSVRLPDGTVIDNSAALESYEVPELSQIVVVEGSVADVDPTRGVTLPSTVVPVPVPIIREVC